jgi:cell surface protein SprA
MNTINAYYEYKLDITPDMQVGSNYITDVKLINPSQTSEGLDLPAARWLQFKIPVTEFDNKIGSISDFRSIRFMRMYMTGFKDEITLRFGALDLVRGEWRRYTGNFDELDTDPDDENTGFDVVALNIQENGQRSPIRYVTPPGVVREQLYNNNTVINQNEQSLSLRVYDKLGGTVNGLESDDARAVFKNVNVDMRQFKKLRMFLHAESIESNTDGNRLQDDEMVAFIRFGNDFTDNFYQVEMPLKVTPYGASTPEEVWPSENEIELPLDLLTKLKILNLQNDPIITVEPNGIGYV